VLGHKVGCWAAGLSPSRPLVLLCGGIVSAKEQWAPALLVLRRMGFAGVVTELPGVGENPLRYDAQSWRMLPGILDGVADRADVTRTYAMALSFSGHLALRAAAADRRIRGVVTAGAPVRAFFTDTAWQAALPSVTVRTLQHLAGTMPSASWAIPHGLLAGLDIPVATTVSNRDEIIPADDVDALRAEVGRLWLAENDDVHGSPHHVRRTRLWSTHAVLRMHGGPALPRFALRALLAFH
jgi:esterase FrsA